jgi:phosphatidate cytidylyltransferase
MAQQEAKPPKNELIVRLLSACVLIPPVLATVYFGHPYFQIFIFVAVSILTYELHHVCERQWGWTFVGLCYFAFAGIALMSLRGADNGLENVVWLFALVWGADTGAYFLGRAIGGPKLAPKISPNKTWAGFAGAAIAAGLAGYGAAVILAKDSVLLLIVFSAILGGLSQLGDLLESWVKRRFHKKDTSGLIPGHGGLFDRADGLIAVAIAVWLIELWINESVLKWL